MHKWSNLINYYCKEIHLFQLYFKIVNCISEDVICNCKNVNKHDCSEIHFIIRLFIYIFYIFYVGFWNTTQELWNTLVITQNVNDFHNKCKRTNLTANTHVKLCFTKNLQLYFNKLQNVSKHVNFVTFDTKRQNWCFVFCSQIVKLLWWVCQICNMQYQKFCLALKTSACHFTVQFFFYVIEIKLLLFSMTPFSLCTLSSGVRRAKVPGRSAPPLRPVHGPFLGELSHPQEPTPTPRHRLHADRLKTPRAETTLCRNVSLLHRPQY